MDKAFGQRLEELISGYQRSQILGVALHARIFDKLIDPIEATTLAEKLGWHPRGTRMLLDGLVALDLVKRSGDAYLNAEIASQCLVSGSPGDVTHILRHKANGYAAWGALGECIRTGEAVPGRDTRNPDELRQFICGMADIAKQSAQAILDAVDLSPYTHMLDVGGGPGTYSIAFAKAHPALRATILDRPDVLPIAEEQIAAADLIDRVQTATCDITRDILPSGADLILVSNIIHAFGAATNMDMVSRCFDAIAPGGLLMIKDFLLDTGRTGPAFGLIFALHMLVDTGDGDTYTWDEVAYWTDKAGFLPGERVDLTPQSRLWLARKPR